MEAHHSICAATKSFRGARAQQEEKGGIYLSIMYFAAGVQDDLVGDDLNLARLEDVLQVELAEVCSV